MIGDQLELALGWGQTPWEGRTPRSLTKVKRSASCVVDKSDVCSESREALRFGTNPAQFILFLEGRSYGS